MCVLGHWPSCLLCVAWHPDGTANKVSDTPLDFCVAMGGVTASADCSVVVVLCLSELPVEELKKASGWKIFPCCANHQDDPETPCVAEDPSQRNISESWPWSVRKLHLIEWTGGSPGQTATPPSDVVHLQSNIDGPRSLSLAYVFRCVPSLCCTMALGTSRLCVLLCR